MVISLVWIKRGGSRDMAILAGWLLTSLIATKFLGAGIHCFQQYDGVRRYSNKTGWYVVGVDLAFGCCTP